MTAHESAPRPSWSPDVAVPLFQELAGLQLTNGIFASYVRSMQAYLVGLDAGEAAATQRAMYIELPLGVSGARDTDDDDPGLKLYLAKVNPMDGQIVVDSISFVGYSADEASGRVYMTFPDSGPPAFTAPQAAFVYMQYQWQAAAGLWLP